ncbi:MAG: class I tRNA ligase family protein, partial [Oscillospiraceae bacterium]
ISRQLWWGHEIPAWYCDECGEITVSRTSPDKCCKCGSKHIHQDEDTLDTWFSSALWAFSTLGWPDKTEDLKYFFPTNVLVTGYDIIFFWVARMIFSTLEQMHEVPFKDVLIHGLVRDSEGRKMSKSLGNGIDPLEIIDSYGADALRLTLATGNAPGNDMRFSDEKVKASRNFCNKVWNASRFILMNIGDENIETTLPADLKIQDKWVLAQLNDVIKSATENIEKYDFGIAVQKVYDFIWDIFCDWYIEMAKTALNEGGAVADNTKRVLVYVLSESLKLLHPFMPFITEEIWQSIPHQGETIMKSNYPTWNEALSFTKEAAEFQMVMDAIRGIRNARANADCPPSRKVTVYVKSDYADFFKASEAFFVKLAGADSVVAADKNFEIQQSLRVVTEK